MSTLSKETQLCSLPDDHDVLGIQHHVDLDTIIVTLLRRISVFDVQQRRLVKNWTVSSFQQLICPVVFDKTTAQYVGALSPHTIQLWTQNDRYIDKSNSINTSKPIHKIFGCISREPLIVFEDGTYCWLHEPECVEGKEATSDSELRVAWCDKLEANDTVHLVVILNSETNKSALLIRSYQLEPDRKLCELTEWQIEDNVDTEEPLSYSTLMKDSSIHVLTLWSDGSLLLSDVTGNDKVSDVPRLGESASIMALDDTQIAVTGIVSKEGENGVGIWDTKFNILLTWQPFTDSSNIASKKLFCTFGHLYTIHEKNLYMYSYRCVPSTLSNALGMLSNKVHDNAKIRSRGPEVLLNQLLDDKRFTTYVDFGRVFRQFYKKCRNQSMIALRNSSQMALLVIRCANERHFWPRRELLSLVQSAFVGNSVCQAVVMSAISHDDAVLLHACLTNIGDISELTLVHILQFFINTDDEKLSIDDFGDKMKVPVLEDCPISDLRAALINTVIAYPCNDIYLFESLKELDFTQVLKMLQYLHYELKASFEVKPPSTESMESESKVAKKKMSKKHRKRMEMLSKYTTAREVTTSETITIAATTASSIATLTQVIDWLSSLLDAHFTQMLLSVETRKYLIGLHQLVEDQVLFLDELGTLDGILSQLKKQEKIRIWPNYGKYSIQNLTL